MRNLLWFVSIAALFSCKNENQPPTPPAPETLKHVPLTLGSFWVYEHFAVDTANGINASTGVKDSIVIHSDTIINGKNYVVRKGIAPFQGVNTWGLIDIVRDSSGYLVNDKGVVLFAENNYIDTFNVWSVVVGNNDTLADIFYTMEVYLDDVKTPSGIYPGGLNYKGTVIQYTASGSFTRYLQNVYVTGIGKILETNFFAGPSQNWVEIRLSKYFIK
jgi:hypothetical protein